MQQEKEKQFHLLLWKAIVLLPYGKSVSVHYLLPVLCISIQASREVGDILYLHKQKERKNVSIKDISISFDSNKTAYHDSLYPPQKIVREGERKTN